MPETVILYWDEEVEAPGVYLGDDDDAADRHDQFAVEVPTEMVDRLEAAWKAANEAMQEIVEAADLDVDEWRKREPCEKWDGDAFPGRTWWQFEIAASGDEDRWPVISTHAGHFDSMLQAQLFLDSLPDPFYVLHGRIWPVPKDWVEIRRARIPESVYPCNRCGWPREQHVTYEAA